MPQNKVTGNNCQAGVTIVEGIVAAGIMAIGILLSASLSSYQMRAARRIDVKMNNLELRSIIRQAVSCPETIYHACRNGRLRLYTGYGVLNLRSFRYEHDIIGNAYSTTDSNGKRIAHKKQTISVTCDARRVDVFLHNFDVNSGAYEKKKLFKNGICHELYDGPVQCPDGTQVLKLNYDEGTIECRPY